MDQALNMQKKSYLNLQSSGVTGDCLSSSPFGQRCQRPTCSKATRPTSRWSSATKVGVEVINTFSKYFVEKFLPWEEEIGRASFREFSSDLACNGDQRRKNGKVKIL